MFRPYLRPSRTPSLNRSWARARSTHRSLEARPDPRGPGRPKANPSCGTHRPGRIRILHSLSAFRLVFVTAPLFLAGGVALGTAGAKPGFSVTDAGRAGTITPADTVRPGADHHVHVWSPAARDVGIRIQEALDQEVVAEEEMRLLSADDVIAGLDSAGIERGVLISTAYFFGMPDILVENESAMVRAENDFVARQVAAHPDRLIGFFSVNPLADYALDEFERLKNHDAFAGVKMHLGNSDVDLRDAEDLARLRVVFARANELGLAVVIHLGGRSDSFGAPDAEAFVNEVLPAAPDVPIQVAHMGGPGGFGPATRASVETFAAAIREHPERTRNLVFDLSAVPHPRYLAQGDTALLRQIEELNRAFVEAARELGFDRVVYGTDYPLVSMPRYLPGIRDALPLTDAEFRDLVETPASYLR